VAAVRAEWGRWGVAGRRQVVRAMVVITIHRSSRPGSRVFDPSRFEVDWL